MRSLPISGLIFYTVLTLRAGLCQGQDQIPVLPDTVPVVAAAPDTFAWSNLMGWRKWDEASRNLYRTGMLEEAIAAAESAYSRSRALGINLPAAGLFWGAKSRRAARDGDWALAERYISLGNLTGRYSPKNIMTGLELAVRQGGWSTALGNAVQLARECRHDFRCQYRVGWMATFWISMAMMAGGLLFMLMLTIKETPYLLHLTADYLPRNWPYWGRFGLITSVALAMTAAIAAFSLPLALIVPSLPLAASGRLRQRIMFWVSLGLVGCSVAGLSLVHQFFVSADRGRVEALSRANISDWDAGLADDLAGMQEATPDDLKPAFALALLEKRRGRLDLAREYLAAIIASTDKNAQALNNLGNVHFFKGRIDSAAECYRQAIEADQGLAESYHNLAQVFLKKIDFNQAREQLAKAAELDPLRMERWSRESGGSLVMDALLEPQMLWAEAMSGWSLAAIPAPGEQYALFGASLWLPWWGWGAWVVLAVAWAWLVGKVLARASCQVCRRSICPRCLAAGQDGAQYCPRCHGQIFSVQSSELQQKAARSLEIQGLRSARIGALAANAILPGMSFALSGGDIKAGLLSLAWGMLLAVLALVRSPWAVAWLDYRAGPDPYLSVGIVALGLWLISWLPFLNPSSFGREQDATGR